MLPKNRAPTSPGEVLQQEFLVPLGITQVELARRMRMTVQTVNQLIKGKRNITAQTALLLARELKTTPEFWMNLQNQVDLWHARAQLESAAHT
jgi:addiction module HigA family antidote